VNGRPIGDPAASGPDNGSADTGLPRGYSSAGRAVALQAIGQGFESPYLQTSPSRLKLGAATFGKPDFAVRSEAGEVGLDTRRINRFPSGL
jgi:hypothetical protein